MELVVMAAGMGSRFGGLKQIEKIDESGNFIIDYSVFDAIRAGFSKVVFIIREEFFEAFKNTIGNRLNGQIEVEYVFQSNDNIPQGVVPSTRTKPLGTAHAILCAKNAVHENFAVINADDFYGRDAYEKIAEFLKNHEKSYAVVGYQAKNTLSKSGSVKRGVLDTCNGKLLKITESKIERKNGKLFAKSISALDGESDSEYEVSDDTLVSMNMLGFTPKIFDELEREMIEFLNANREKLETAEFLIPDVLEKLNQEKRAEVLVLETTAKWLGITYHDDLDDFKSELHKLVKNGEYPKTLWKPVSNMSK